MQIIFQVMCVFLLRSEGIDLAVLVENLKIFIKQKSQDNAEETQARHAKQSLL